LRRLPGNQRKGLMSQKKPGPVLET
jgi:hypothetical protein